MSQTNAAPPLDASGVLVWKLLEFFSNKRPSAREELGNKRLHQARTLALANETIISPGDLEVVKDKLTLATEIRAGLGSKWGISKLLQAQEYSKSAKDVLRFVETVSGRARDAMLGQKAVGLNPILIGIDNTSASIDPRLYVELKPKVAVLVENLYDFSTSRARESISSNSKRARMLLTDMTFVYPEVSDGGKRNRHNPYRHPIIQRVIDTTFFRDKGDVGVIRQEHFSPMPIPIIAFTLTVVECCINEWSEGIRKDSSWDDAKLQAVYASHVASLFDFKAHSPANNDVLHQLQCDLLKNACKHAGVTPYPVMESGRFPPGALDAVRKGCNQPSHGFSVHGELEIPGIVIETVDV